MSDARLAFTHEREVKKLARRFRAGRRSGFVVCVGASESLRARVESELTARTGEGHLVSTVLPRSVVDPWGALLGARTAEGQVVSARVEDKIEERALRLFDVQREVLHGEALSLMLWVSLGEMERVASLASNLWSYRSDVAWFLSHADIEASEVEPVDESPVGPSIEERLQRVEEGLAGKRTARPDLLAEKGWLLARFGRYREALAALEEAKPHLKHNSFDEQQWRWAMMDLLRKQYRMSEMRRFVEEGRHKNAPRDRVLERVEVARDSTEWRTAFARLESLLVNDYRWEVTFLEGPFGSECARAADELVGLGHLTAAERWLHEAMKAIRRRQTDWWPMVVSYVEDTRAEIAWERLDTIHSLRAQQRRSHLAERAGAMDQQAIAYDKLAGAYAQLGLVDDERVFRDRAKRMRERLHAGPSPPAASDAPPERPVDTPFARLERAVYDAEKALDDGRSADVSASLDGCAEAWAAEDERFRSLRLFDRWQRALARHLVAQGDEARAVTVLQEAAEMLRDLPRTRLGTLLALAQLSLAPEHTSAREAAATEVLGQAITAGTLALERDARRVLAPIVRERGETEEADFHEAEAQRITAALDLTTPSTTAKG